MSGSRIHGGLWKQGEELAREPAVTAELDRAPANGVGERRSGNVDFWIDDADRAAERVGELGGRLVLGPYDTPGFRQCVLADPNGATFTVSQLMMAHG